MTKDFIDEGYPRGLAFASVVRKIRRGGTAKSDISRTGEKVGGERKADQDGHKFRGKGRERGRLSAPAYYNIGRNITTDRDRSVAVARHRRVTRRI